MKTVFLRVLEADDKAAALLAAIHDPSTAHGKQRFEVNSSSFASAGFTVCVLGNRAASSVVHGVPALRGQRADSKSRHANLRRFPLRASMVGSTKSHTIRALVPFRQGREVLPVLR